MILEPQCSDLLLVLMIIQACDLHCVDGLVGLHLVAFGHAAAAGVERHRVAHVLAGAVALALVGQIQHCAILMLWTQIYLLCCFQMTISLTHTYIETGIFRRLRRLVLLLGLIAMGEAIDAGVVLHVVGWRLPRLHQILILVLIHRTGLLAIDRGPHIFAELRVVVAVYDVVVSGLTLSPIVLAQSSVRMHGIHWAVLVPGGGGSVHYVLLRSR